MSVGVPHVVLWETFEDTFMVKLPEIYHCTKLEMALPNKSESLKHLQTEPRSFINLKAMKHTNNAKELLVLGERTSV
jgi:5'(3')-deoxyribonucleotidase